MVCAVAGLRAGLLLAAWRARRCWPGLMRSTGSGCRRQRRHVGREPGLRTLMHLLVIGAGLAGGLLVSRVVSRYVRSADDREQRFRGLLRIAADAYWEIDDAVPAGHLHAPGPHQRLDGPGQRRRPAPWELPEFGLDDDTLDRCRPTWRRARPSATCRCGGACPGRCAHFLVSGEPRSDGAGAFIGYWGVARDVSADVHGARRRWRPPRRATRSCSRASRRRWCCTAAAACIDANPAALACSATPTCRRMLGQRPAGRLRGRRLARTRAPPHRSAAADGRRRGACRWPTSGCTGAQGGASSCAPPACAWTRRTARRCCRSSSTTPSAPPRTRCAAPRRCCRTWSPPAPT